MAGELAGNVGCILPTLDLREAGVGDPAVSGAIVLPPQSLCTCLACYAILTALCCPFSLSALSPTL